ncbi:MAG: ubiG [Rhodospirillales bacterium]|nr:ubiG [Rhodospirillales bacterium]
MALNCRRGPPCCFRSTLNRTLRSLLLGVGFAEHVLRWVEPGTHDWRKFVRPSEMARSLRHAGFDLVHQSGLVLGPLRGEFRLDDLDVGIKYLMTAILRS